MDEKISNRLSTLRITLTLVFIITFLSSASAHAVFSSSGHCDFVTFLGDSNTNLWYLRAQSDLQYPRLSRNYRFSDIVGRKLPIPVYNYGQGGAKTEDLLTGKRYNQWDYRNNQHKHGIYIISFGLNDHKQFATRFNSDWNLTLRNYYSKTRQLILEIKSKGGRPVLMSMPPVDYPKHHHYDRNKIIDKYNTIYQTLGKDMNVPIIDINRYLKSQFKRNIWDIYIRNPAYTKGIYVLDSSQDHGNRNANWYSNIHYNLNGSRLVADYITQRLQHMGCNKRRFLSPSTILVEQKPSNLPINVNKKNHGRNRTNKYLTRHYQYEINLLQQYSELTYY